MCSHVNGLSYSLSRVRSMAAPCCFFRAEDPSLKKSAAICRSLWFVVVVAVVSGEFEFATGASLATPAQAASFFSGGFFKVSLFSVTLLITTTRRGRTATTTKKEQVELSPRLISPGD